MSKRLSPTAKSILKRLHDKGGTDAWWPDKAEAGALRALENRKLVFFNEEAARSGNRHGMPYSLTGEGQIAYHLEHGK